MPQSACAAEPRARLDVDFIEAGRGPLVVLIHASTSGARQWSALMHELADRFHVRAVNLFGYGRTPPWSAGRAPLLSDYARLAAAAIPLGARDVTLVGHSFGGAVAMEAARQLTDRVEGLVLVEPCLFSLLDAGGRREAYAEISAVADETRRDIEAGRTDAAAERFIDYWTGAGAWAATSPERKASFARLMALLPHEWPAVLHGERDPAELLAALPRHTMTMWSANTTRAAREVVEALYQARPDWEFRRIAEAGHMAPLTHPGLVNPAITAFLDRRSRRLSEGALLARAQ